MEYSSNEQSDREVTCSSSKKRKLKHLADFSGSDLSPEVKRRSSRLIPGFFIEG